MPQRRLTAEDIDKRLGQKLGWTRANTGVISRFECTAPESLVTMGLEAMKRAITSAGIDWHQIDCILSCSTSQFRLIPCNAAHFQQAIGSAAAGIPCFDVQSTCLGSLVGMHLANSLLGTTDYRNILLVAAESALGGVNWNEPESASLIGDGAAALVLSKCPSTRPFYFVHETYAKYLDLCKVNAGGHYRPFYNFSDQSRNDFLFSMNGPRLFRVALAKLIPMVRSLLEKWQEADGQLDQLQVVPHQASPKALERVREALQFSKDRFHVAIDEVGNMAAASIPWMLDHLIQNQKINRGDTALLMGTSAGYSQAAMILEI